MTDKILVPFDGSENSKKGLKYACALAKKVGAPITVLYVVNIPYTGESAVLHVESLIKVGREILEGAKRIVKEEKCEPAHYDLRQGIGNPAHQIVDFCNEGDFSLIVMSARGHTPLTHILLGSVSENVVHHAPCPVLIVR
jgi:nucleotide-binding universal stress UspA family protein